ncbi:MAG: hypothetical protein LC107_12005 [Chitinophagales bacterium]|nr:hypothetical protein [Chitinophagales bacterium]
MQWWIVGILGLAFMYDIEAQVNPHVLHQRQIVMDSCTMNISKYSLLPSTVIITHKKDTLQGWYIDNTNIVWDASLCAELQGDTISIEYRTIGYDIEAPIYVIDTTQLNFREILIGSGFEFKPDGNKNPLIDAKGLDYRGSFSRGLSIGNSQSLVLNSNFDMQMIGDLGNGLKIVAAISDDNLPIQAQGNTQQLQEFDKIFIQVSKDKTSVIAGDYELRRPNSYFMNYFKKLKGISLDNTFQTEKGIEIFNRGSFAISRGKFARQTLATTESNQGPYRLQGNNNERFIIVLAGTERVYYNGVLLTRGFDYDYVIDYNRAEITFSPSRVITRDARVIVEFEYTDISYLRSLYATQTEFKSKNWNVNLNFYSEQDSKQGTGDVQLDSIDLLILRQSGDDLTKSVRSSIRPASEEEKREPSRILYAGMPDPLDPSVIILRFTENIDSAAYIAVFTEVGSGKGDYVIDAAANKNGRIYRYVGKNQGTYLPIVQLVPPEQRQMITLNGNLRLNNKASVYGEVALSNVDINRISDLDKRDNTGISSLLMYKDRFSLDTMGNWLLNADIQHEFVNRHFEALNPYRATEFVRDWNLPVVADRGDENLILTSLNLKNNKGFNLQYGLNLYDKQNIYFGVKHNSMVQFDYRQWSFKSVVNYLSSKSNPADELTTFLRPNIALAYKLGKDQTWKLGFVYDGEINTLRGIQQDTLKKGSNAYHHFKWFVDNDFSKDFGTKVVYSIRKDYLPQQGALTDALVAHELELVSKWQQSEHSNLQWSIIGRQLSVENAGLLPDEHNKKSVLGKLDYLFSLLNQGIRSVTSYNTNSGQEPKVEYVFSKVEPGQGDYVFIGDEENPNLNNIQDFRYDPANPSRSYIRLSLPNNEFVRTNNLELNQSLNIEPVKFKKPVEGKPFSKMYRFISRFATASNARIAKKQHENQAGTFASFFNFGLGDTSLVSYNATISNTLFFNRGNVKFDIQIGNRNNQNRSLQISGQEDRGLKEYFFRSRYNIMNQADIFVSVEKSQKTYDAVAFEDRDLDIESIKFNPEINYRPGPNVRLIARYAYQDKRQKVLTMDRAYINNFTGEFSWRKATEYSLDMSASVVLIQFTGLSGSALEYDMLDGLKDGRNYLWNMVYTKRIAQNIDLTFNYEGRKAGISPIVHVGRAQIKATF